MNKSGETVTVAEYEVTCYQSNQLLTTGFENVEKTKKQITNKLQVV